MSLANALTALLALPVIAMLIAGLVGARKTKAEAASVTVDLLLKGLNRLEHDLEETREQLAEAMRRIDECERDRADLHRQIEALRRQRRAA